MKIIRVYRVFLTGEPFLLERDGKKIEYGFYRNEYVASSSEEKAIAIAKTRTLRKLNGMAIEMIEGRPIELRVEELKAGIPIWYLFRNEGFVFFRVDS